MHVRQIQRERIWLTETKSRSSQSWIKIIFTAAWMAVHSTFIHMVLFPPLPTSFPIPRPSWGPSSLPPASSAPWAAAPPGHEWQSLWCAASLSQPRQLSGPAAWPPPPRSGPFQPAGPPSAPNAAGEEREEEKEGQTQGGKEKRKYENGRRDEEVHQRKRDENMCREKEERRVKRGVEGGMCMNTEGAREIDGGERGKSERH